MALDNAEFIAELSIVDPPGSDPLNQGDDHIRTTKKAVQQSFPNVNAAVPQTAAQMGQMAIKNEVNAFTQPNTFVEGQTFTTGLAVQQLGTDVSDFRFRNSLGTIRWILRNESDALGNDFKIQRRNSAGAFVDNPISIDASNGFINFNTAAGAFFGQALRLETAATPSTAVQTGMLFIGGSGTLRWSLSRQADDVTGDLVINRHDGNGSLLDTPFRVTNARGVQLSTPGRAGDPTYSFADDPDMGMYRGASNVLAFSTVGVERMNLTATAMQVKQPVHVPDGTSVLPTLSFQGHPDTGMFIQAGANLGFSAGSVRRFLVKSNTCNMNLPTTNAGLVSGDCFVSSGFVAIVP